MKLTYIALSLALIGTMSLTMAEDTVSSTQASSGIDAEIAKIQAAPATQRVEMMNQFKEKLMQMNQEDRMAAITAMREQMHANGHTTMNEVNNHSEMAQNHMQEHTQEMQMQATEHMNQMQHMNQNHAGDQMNSMHDSMMHGGSPENSPMGGSHFNQDIRH